MTNELERAVAAHYARPNLLDAIDAGLAAARIAADQAEPADLAPVDEFHTAGRRATRIALERFPLTAGMHVLDAGCGIGGTARLLAGEYDCRVTGLDLTANYVETARRLSERFGLNTRCTFIEGSVVDMPFEDDRFDAGLSFHVAMNVADRARFYAELARTLRADAPLCLFDVMRGPTAGMRYPVPWAETDATSFLLSRDETVDALAGAGFELESEENLRQFAIDFFAEVLARQAQADGPPPLGLHLLTGADTEAKFSNYVQALHDHQIEPVVIVGRRR